MLEIERIMKKRNREQEEKKWSYAKTLISHFHPPLLFIGVEKLELNL